MIRFGALKFARKGDQNTLNFDKEIYVQYSTLPESEMHTLYVDLETDTEIVNKIA